LQSTGHAASLSETTWLTLGGRPESGKVFQGEVETLAGGARWRKAQEMAARAPSELMYQLMYHELGAFGSLGPVTED
jgi:hypothetical protein